MDFPLLLAAAPLKLDVLFIAIVPIVNFPLLLAAAPLKRTGGAVAVRVIPHCPLLLAAAPLKPGEARVIFDELAKFSAAFSGGPIEALQPWHRNDAGAPDFPLLLAAAPLKPFCSPR